MLKRRITKVSIVLASAATTLACLFALFDLDLNVRLQLICDGVPFATVRAVTQENSQHAYSTMASGFVYSGQNEIGLVDMGGVVELDRDVARRGDFSDEKEFSLIKGLTWIGFASTALMLIAIVCWTPRIDLTLSLKR